MSKLKKTTQFVYKKQNGRKKLIMLRLNLGNTKIPHHKNTADMKPVRMPPPKEVLLSMSQNIGAPADPVVKVGDHVKIGQLVADSKSPISSPIYSSVSGTVTGIETYMRNDGKSIPALRIQSDGLMTVIDGIVPPTVTDFQSLISAVRSSGVVGLGGAGFPTAIKMNATHVGKVHTIILNGSECEPYITVDHRTMIDDADDIRYGIELFKSFVPGIKNFIIGIEKNKPSCISKLKEVFSDDDTVAVRPLPLLYPQGTEKVLIHTLTKLTVPEGKLHADVGVLVVNVTTVAAIARYVKTGMPFVERHVTVDGSAIKSPMNVIAPLGTHIRDLIEFTGGFKEEPAKVIFGGPMTGTAVHSLDEPIVKATNAVLAFAKRDTVTKPSTACIHCGKCVESCPHMLEPTSFSKALEIDDRNDRLARLEELRINLCIECGCCSYVCPASRPLVENNKIAKSFVREYKDQRRI